MQAPHSAIRFLVIASILLIASMLPRLSIAQPGPDDPPATYEVQVDGESFQVEANQRPIKVESQVKKGTIYSLAVRVSMTQILRLNSVQLEYGMWAKAYDDKGKEVRIVQIVNDLGFTLRVTDVGHILDDAHADKLMETLIREAGKKYKGRKATDLKKAAPVVRKLGVSSGKSTTITYKDENGRAAHTTIIFVLSGEKYTVAAEAEFRDQDLEDGMPGPSSKACNQRCLPQKSGFSIRPLH